MPTTITGLPNSISQPTYASPGADVTVSPSGGTVYVQSTTASTVEVQNGTAIWQTWPAGGVSIKTSDAVTQICALRLVCVTGSATMEVGDAKICCVNDPSKTWLSSIKSGFPQSGARALLFGDSMTDQYNLVSSPPTTTNDRGTVTISGLSAPGLWDGAPMQFWNRNNPALIRQITVAVKRISATSFSFFVPAAVGLPDGAIPGTTFVRYPNRVSDMSWIAWLQFFGVPINVVRNVAQSGDTIFDNLARWSTDVEPYIGTFDIIIAQMPGINDQSTSNGALPDVVTEAAAKQWLDLVSSIGVKVFLGLITPVASGEGRATLAIMQRVQRLNRFLIDYARRNKNIIILDHYRQIIDPTNATGLALPGLMRASDNIHYNVASARKVALADLATFQAELVGTDDTRPESVIDSFTGSALSVTNASTTRVGTTVTVTTGVAHGYRIGESVRISVVSGSNPSQDIRGWRVITGVPSTTSFTFEMVSALGDFATAAGTITTSQCRNLFWNPLLTTATGGLVSSPYTGVSALGIQSRNLVGTTNAGVASVVPHPDGFGNMQQIVVTTGSTGDVTGIRTTPINTTLNETMGAGQSFVFELEIRLSSTNWALTPIREIFVWFTITVDGVDIESRVEQTESGGSAGITGPTTLRVRVPECRIPADAAAVTAAYFSAGIRTSAAFSGGPELTIQFGRIAVWQTDQLR
jgi:hypothetical protein